MNMTYRGTIFLMRHGCGHYSVEASTVKLSAGAHRGSVRVATTDGRCPACLALSELERVRQQIDRAHRQVACHEP